MFVLGGETDENPCAVLCGPLGIDPLVGMGPADLGDPKPGCLDVVFPNAPPNPNTGRRLDAAFGGGGTLEGGGSSLEIAGVPLPSSASSKISLATNDESLSATIPPLLGNNGSEDA